VIFVYSDLVGIYPLISWTRPSPWPNWLCWLRRCLGFNDLLTLPVAFSTDNYCWWWWR